METLTPRADASAPDDPVPLFGTWPRIYAAVVVSAVAHLLLIALFSAWTY